MTIPGLSHALRQLGAALTWDLSLAASASALSERWFQTMAAKRFISHNHDRRIASDVLDAVVENGVAKLDPAMGRKRRALDGEHPIGAPPSRSQKIKERQGLLQTGITRPAQSANSDKPRRRIDQVCRLRLFAA